MRWGLVTVVPAVALGVVLCGCGLGRMQTARTTPEGMLDIGIGAGYLHNELTPDRGIGPTSFPLHAALRLGVLDRLDVGLEMLAMGGASADVKYNLVPNEYDVAVALSGGFGGARDVARSRGFFLSPPVHLAVSYEIADVVTPYAGLGYRFFWVFDRDEAREEGERYADRGGYGDGVLVVNVGIEAAAADWVAFLAEYNYWHQVVDDPGDFYSFVDNHIVQVGMRFSARVFGQ